MERSKHLFREYLLPLMRIAAQDRLLDVGCGDGWACRIMAGFASSGTVVGLDASTDRIGEARRHSVGFENILHIAAEAEENPWQDGFFTHAVMIDTLYRVKDPAGALRHTHRVLAPGGALWILNQIAHENGTAALIEADEESSSKLLRADEYVEMLRSCGFVEPAWQLLPAPDGAGASSAELFSVLITAIKPVS
ncbi:MAG: class I SAM-dependent methyltransferase [Acidobacteria bacterium]|nr:class I SAM-dependent methyltransferase [Acidobacteriota bacterium]